MKKIQIELDEIKSYKQLTVVVEHTNEQTGATLQTQKLISVQMLEKGDKPIKGVDYFTEADKQELLRDIQYEAGIDAIAEADIVNLF